MLSQLFTQPVVALVARRAGLVAHEPPPWTATSAEAAVLLNNLLVLNRDFVATALCTPEHVDGGVGALTKLIASLKDAATEQPLARLRLYGPIAFHVSLAPAAFGSFGAAFLAAAMRTLTYIGDHLAVPGDDTLEGEVAIAAGLAADIVRTLFNLVRACLSDAQGSDKPAVEELLAAVATLLRAGTPDAHGNVWCAVGERDEGAARAAILEAKVTALQLPVVLPPELAYPALKGEWKGLLDDLLLPLLKAAGRGNETTSAATAPVVPLVVLEGIAKCDGAVCELMRKHIFPPQYLNAELDPKDPYRPAGEPSGFDPNKEEIPDDASLRIRLIYCLTSIDHTLKTTAGEFLLAVCDGDSQEFVRLCGLGSAAGLVQQKDMMSMFSNLATGGGA